MSVLQLTAKSGPMTGRTWPITATPLVLGRSTECDVVIADSLVSRRHCTIVLEGEHARLTDLGSSNTTLVNGVSEQDGLLRAGDEISLGRETFLITTPSDAGAGFSSKDPGESTVSITDTEAIYLSDRAASVPGKGRAKTIQDITQLFRISRELGSVASTRDLVETLAQRIRERFSPQTLCIAKIQEDGEGLDILLRDGESFPAGEKPALDLMLWTAQQVRGALVPPGAHPDTKSRAYTLLSPVALGGHSFGVILIHSKSDLGAYNENDLEFLVALGATAAPFFHAIERMELLRSENEMLRKSSDQERLLVGESEPMRRLRSLVRRAAPSDLNVLILGETGTGKELVAHMLHDLSSRSEGPFIPLNCAALPAELFSSELFGYERGAFTGATHRKIGQIELANGGTLFLDEIGDLSLENQAKFLRVVEQGTFSRLGSEKETRVDVRVVAATNKEIPRLVREGAFREDLYHRINGVEIHVPPLRERSSDVLVLAERFFNQGLRMAKRPVQSIASEAIEYLRKKQWPGNVRELRNCVERAVALARNNVLQTEDFEQAWLFGTPDIADAGAESLLPLDEMEKQHIIRVLRACGGKVADAAQILQISRSTLYNKISAYGIEA